MMWWCMVFERGKGWSLLAIMDKELAWAWVNRHPGGRRAFCAEYGVFS